jgi:transposase
LAHAGKTDEEIAEALQISLLTIYNIRRRFQTEGLDLLYDKPHPGQPCKLDGKAEARLTAIACSTPPAGHARWSLRLLADELVRLEVVDTISHKTVGQVLKKRHQTVAEAAVVSRANRWRILGAHGGNPGFVRTTL